jgi:hypothetical protein
MIKLLNRIAGSREGFFRAFFLCGHSGMIQRHPHYLGSKNDYEMRRRKDLSKRKCPECDPESWKVLTEYRAPFPPRE